MRIAICDDEVVHQNAAFDLLQSYLSARSFLCGEIQVFGSGEILLSHIEKYGGFDLYLLDILMPEMNGMEIGRRLRQLGSRGEIIFLTNSNGFAADSYDVEAFSYLLKPVQEEKLYSVLDRVIQKRNQSQQKVIIVHTAEGASRIQLDNLCYVERVGRVARYNCTDGVVDSQTIRISFKELVAPLLEDQRFYMCGASYVLNFQHVVKVNNQKIYLDTGETIVLPRTVAPEFKKHWGNYWLGKESFL